MKAKQFTKEINTLTERLKNAIKSKIEELFEGEEAEKEIYFREVGSPISYQYIDDQFSTVIDRVELTDNGVLMFNIDDGDSDTNVNANELSFEQLIGVLEIIEDLTKKDLGF